MNLALFQLADAYLVVLSQIPDDADDEQVSQAINVLAGAITHKGQNITAFCLNLIAEADAIEGAAKKLLARAATIQRKQERLREYLFVNMKATGITEIKANDGTFRAKIVKNPPSVHIAGPVPSEYERVIPEKREPDKVKIKDELKAGVIIENCLLVQNERLKLE